MNIISNKIDIFTKKLSTYDKDNWEIVVEKYKSRSNYYEIYKSNKLFGKQYIDLDLVKGKTFHKAKPLYNLSTVTFKAFYRIFLFPIFFNWWIDQLDFYTYLFYLFIYIIQLFIVLLHAVNITVSDKFSFIECHSFILMSFIVGEIFHHVTLKNLTRPNIKPTKSPTLRSYSFDNIAKCSSDTQLNIDDVLPMNRISTIRRKLSTGHDVKLFGRDGANDGGILDIDFKLPKNEPDSDNEVLQVEHHNEVNDEGLDDNTSHISNSSSSLSENGDKENIIQPIADIAEEGINVALERQKIKNQELVMVTFLEKESIKKLKITIFEILKIIDDRVNSLPIPLPSSYIIIFLSFYFAFLPYIFQVSMLIVNHYRKSTNFHFYQIFSFFIEWFYIQTHAIIIIMFLIIFVRFIMICSYLFLLIVAEKSYRLRYYYAKFFGSLTSRRRAKRNHLPHFRLSKVRNIKAWLSIRSYLRRFGPLHSIDMVVSFTFYLSILFVTLLCGKLLYDFNYNKSDLSFIEQYINWELTSWSIFLSCFLLRFMSLGAEVNRKYNNYSDILTEQINLYLNMDSCPQKKEEFVIANNLLKLASKLIKEVEGPKKGTGFIMNPLLRNITRVVILSLISGVVSEIFGVSFKFWKIKAS